MIIGINRGAQLAKWGGLTGPHQGGYCKPSTAIVVIHAKQSSSSAHLPEEVNGLGFSAFSFVQEMNPSCWAGPSQSLS